jgi:hypothetical protein
MPSNLQQLAESNILAARSEQLRFCEQYTAELWKRLNLAKQLGVDFTEYQWNNTELAIEDLTDVITATQEQQTEDEKDHAERLAAERGEPSPGYTDSE